MTTSFLKHGLMVLTAACLVSAAYCDGSATWTDANGVTWKFDYSDDGHNAAITGIDGSSYPSNLVIPRYVYVDSVEYWVREIQSFAFDGEYDRSRCDAITSVTLQDVQEIGNYAFYHCDNLASVTFGYENDDDEGRIGFGAFAKTALTRVAFPPGKSYWQIKTFAFEACTSLNEIIFNNQTHLCVDVDAFLDTPLNARMNANDNWADAIELTGSAGTVTGCNIIATGEPGEPKVSEAADTEENSLWWKWTPPSGVTQVAFMVDSSDFEPCLSIYTGTAVDYLSRIDYDYGDGVLPFAVTPGVTYFIRVQGGDFWQCGNFRLSWRTARADDGFSLIVMEGGKLAGFLGPCPETLTIPDGITEIGLGAFSCNRNPSAENLKYLEVPDSVKRIGGCAFYNCYNLVSAKLGTGIEVIDYLAFDGCNKLASVTLGENLKRIDNQAFRKTSLTNVRIPYGVESIGFYAFYGCNKLMSVLLPSRFKGNPALTNVFKECPADMAVTYYDEVKYAGVVDAKFAKAQTVRGALYNATGKLSGVMEVKFGKKGKKGVKVKATATLMNGKKVSSTAGTLNGGPVTLTFKGGIGKMTLEMISDGMFSLKNAAYETSGGTIDKTEDGTVISSRTAKVGGKMASRTMFFSGTFDPVPSFGAGMARVEKALPLNMKVAVTGAKWNIAKAKTLKYVKVKEGGAVRYDLPVADGENVSGLKLAYAYKTGMFKGSFKMYATNAGAAKPKLKKYTVKVIGFVVADTGTGEATLKKPSGGPWTVTVR
ncbi:MAG: leucine-rich repeat domain-containing protein [Kiritimatiellae bacterium]|nr:leucine-rich repeat domain-containing protein [Kiritimatiellia bacterium]